MSIVYKVYLTRPGPDSRRADYVAVGQDDLEVQGVLLDGPVPHCVGTAGPSSAHTANRGVGPRVHWEPETLTLQSLQIGSFSVNHYSQRVGPGHGNPEPNLKITWIAFNRLQK